MRRTFIVSGIVLAILLVLFLSGVIDYSDSVRQSLLKGNSHYAVGEYDKALEAYKTGLGKEPENEKLNYNSGQVSYILKDYQQAAGYFANASDNEDKYLNWGNSFLRLGEETTDEIQKFMCYNQALEVYKQGILSYPENMALKYNYEYVLEKIGTMDSNGEKQPEERDEQKDQDGEKQQNQDGDNQQDRNNKNQESQDNEEQQDQEKEQQDQNGSQSQQNSNQEESTDNEEQENKQHDETEDNRDRQGENQQKHDNQAAQEQENTPTGSELEQVLEMLERQEKDSLKNNREIRGRGKEDEYDW
jgi:Ca-activated chloride channel family protein